LSLLIKNHSAAELSPDWSSASWSRVGIATQTAAA
jgi:hypothetical protein